MWTHWRTHFETTARRPYPGAPTDIDRLPPAWREPLCASLARFQLGESGEGRIAREITLAACERSGSRAASSPGACCG